MSIVDQEKVLQNPYDGIVFSTGFFFLENSSLCQCDKKKTAKAQPKCHTSSPLSVLIIEYLIASGHSLTLGK